MKGSSLKNDLVRHTWSCLVLSSLPSFSFFLEMAILWRSTLQRVGFMLMTLFDTLIWVSGPLFILIAVVLVGGCAVFYFLAVVPYVFPTMGLLYLLNLLVSIWIVLLLVFNYFSCVLTKPGSPTPISVCFKKLMSIGAAGCCSGFSHPPVSFLMIGGRGRLSIYGQWDQGLQEM